eukprot:CAMPEP_0172319034 /NCGR_PEP_ID=MMETSP1058-20130122/36584_1 /TAXON_ID=83371 /ORGANISM="Detonula confervacea, Strain CCMP 353" /LENGTH=312 /DNA_ID=CAMNT_0013033977 /DNA_START=116 /DNA_END=1054 /DNA_ORIENTATION=+
MAQGTADAETSNVNVSADPSIINSEHSKIDDKRLAPFLIRLHLIRHGETLANAENIVLGQGDSPLTDNGVAVAQLAAASDIINGKKLRYFRTYCSDLYRAHRTARIVLGLEDGDGNAGESSGIDLIVDPRLRELAKGAREEYPKKLSYEEALSRRRDVSEDDAEIKAPKLETLEEGWRRVKNWIDSMIDDASNDYYSINANEVTQDNDSCDANGGELDPKIYDIFALSHSALIRTMIHKMVGAELQQNYATTKEGSLLIPNLSRTIIDVRPYESHPSKNNNAPSSRWTSTLFRLTDVSHLNDAAPHNGPPYL